MKNTQNAFASDNVKMTEDAAAKVASMQSARQKLAEASDIYKVGGDKINEAKELANEAAIALFNLRVAGRCTPDEASAALGDVFGFKMKQDKTASKTPLGEGEAIRKRIVRAVAAYEYVMSPTTEGFFAGLDPADLQPTVEAIAKGKYSIWTAYEDFAKLKNAHAVRLEAAFDHTRVTAMVARLASAEALLKIFEDPALRTAYTALFATLDNIGQGLAKLDKDSSAVMVDKVAEETAELNEAFDNSEKVAA